MFHGIRFTKLLGNYSTREEPMSVRWTEENATAFALRRAKGMQPVNIGATESKPCPAPIAAKDGSLSFTIKVVPMGAPRMTRSDAWRKRDVVLRYFEFKDVLRKAVGVQDVPDSVRAFFYIPMSASWSKRVKLRMDGKPHKIKPDTDNLFKGVLDALFSQDSAIWKIDGEKRWCKEGEERIELTLFYYKQT